MPCTECGKLLCVEEDDPHRLSCPYCGGLPIESQGVINAKTEFLINDHLPQRLVDSLLTQYKKHSLTYALISDLDRAANRFLSAAEEPLRKNDFGTTGYLIRHVYDIEEGEFGDKVIDQEPQELTEAIETVREYYQEYVDRCERAQNRHSVCIRADEYTGEWVNFPSDYDRRLTEFGVTFNRCAESVGGDEADYDIFDFLQGKIRRVEKTDPREAETPREFADAWYELIQQFRFVAASDDRVGSTYYTPFPEGVTVFDIREFLERIHGALHKALDEDKWEAFENESYVAPLREEWVARCGEATFGADWNRVRPHIVVSEENLDAHPFLFELTVDIEQEMPRGSTVTIPTTNIYYPRNYAFLLQFQAFPMLKNSKETPTGHELLSQVAGDRGTARERNFHEFLTNQGIHCYHSAEITRSNPNEIDLLCITEDYVHFIEVKYIFPPLRIGTQAGIEKLNEKFDELIFKELSPNSDQEPTGKPFPDKVETWLELEPNDKFTSQISWKGERQKHYLPEQWGDLKTEKIVISNVVPSYIEKHDVRFFTDFEFCKLLIRGEDSHLYSVEQ